MKKIFKNIITFILRISARILILRKKPKIFAITGSAGKTSTKEFLKNILSHNFEVLAPAEGYNTEIGSVLGLFSEKVPENINSIMAWVGLVLRIFIKSLTLKDFPKRVIVEMGADKPGDIRYLCDVFRPQVGIILTVLPVHLEEFKTIHAVSKEKSELARSIPASGRLYLNWDNEEVRKMATLTKAEVVYFGQKAKSGYQIRKINSNLKGLELELVREGKEIKFVANLYGNHLVYPLVASIAVALDEGMTLATVKEAVRSIKPFKGRMNVIEGIRDSIIIDDSYNANPESMIKAIEFLGKQTGRKIALLGTMNELGEYEKEGHEKVGREIVGKADILCTVGDAANTYLVGAAKKAGFAESKIKCFKNSLEAGIALKKIIKSGDTILVKGSQNRVRTEIAIEQIMAHPEQKREILVRQSDFWNGRL